MNRIDYCLDLIRDMKTEDFRTKLMRKVMSTKEFSRLMSFGGPDALDEADKKKICADLNAAGLPLEYSNDKSFKLGFETITTALAGRAARLE